MSKTNPKIRQCEFAFHCPKTWDSLLETNVESVRFCGHCEKNVYLSTTVDEALKHAGKGECVAIPIELTAESKKKLNVRLMEVGMLRPPPYKKENIEDLYARYVADAAEFYGIDGCPAGWFYVGIDTRGDYQFGVLEKFRDVGLFANQAKLTLVDIPIGLTSSGITERLCDSAARNAIKPRGASVFPAPARVALQEHTYARGSEVNHLAVGRKLSTQSWAIVPKIREVDHHMRTQNIQDKVREMHPEVAFWALNERTPLKHTKKKQEGAEERLDILMRFFPGAEDCLERALDTYKRKDVAEDDILDAMAGAVTAMQFPRIATLPEMPARDEEGLTMEMVYALI